MAFRLTERVCRWRTVPLPDRSVLDLNPQSRSERVKTGQARVRRNEVIGVLSLATDFAIGQPLGYGLRSATASAELARHMGLGAGVEAEAYYHGLLRYCGCTAETDK